MARTEARTKGESVLSCDFIGVFREARRRTVERNMGFNANGKAWVLVDGVCSGFYTLGCDIC